MLLRHAVAALRRRRDRGALALYLALGLVALAEIAAATVPAVERQLMAAHQLREMPLVERVAIQLVPKMYSYAHNVWYSDVPDGPPESWSAPHWINHYPGRVVRMEGVRASLARDGVTQYVLVRSAYRGVVLSTTYRVHVEDGHLVVRRVGERP